VNGEPDAITLEYDGHQQRIRKVTPKTETIYVGDLYERVTNVLTGVVEHRYHVFSSERMIAVVTRKTGAPQKTLYVHVDSLGSVDVLTDDAGAVVERRSYDAFGERRNPAWGGPPLLLAAKTSRGFTGHEDDEELGLVNLKGRLYDPHLGRLFEAAGEARYRGSPDSPPGLSVGHSIAALSAASIAEAMRATRWV
jgi:RHS repeat-associated protein